MPDDSNEKKDKSGTERRKIIGKWFFELTLIIISCFLSHYLTVHSEEERFVNALSEYSEYVTKGMSAEQAIARLKYEKEELEEDAKNKNDSHSKEVDSLKEEIKRLNEKMDSMIDATIKGPKLVVDGMEREVDKGIASDSMILYKDRPYYSEGLANAAQGGVFSYAASFECK